jgi:hypothetical protein
VGQASLETSLADWYQKLIVVLNEGIDRVLLRRFQSGIVGFDIQIFSEIDG